VAADGASVRIGRLCVIGVGLIGGSLALDLRRLGLCAEVVGCSRNESNLRRAKELSVIDRFHTDPAEAVRGADLVLVAVPLGAMGAVFQAMAPGLGADTVVTDAGSAKRSVIDAARAGLGERCAMMVPGHPIAGAENSGVDAAEHRLYESRRVILTPMPESRPAAVERVRAMWQAVGAEVLEMDPAHHDEVLAATSHLPHMLAYTLVDVLGRMEDRVEIFRYAAGGFRDFTRIASSDPQMWHDICLANRDALAAVLARFATELNDLESAVRHADGATIFEIFTRAKALRDRYTREHDTREHAQ
jgi:prephenate dehydrogenase